MGPDGPKWGQEDFFPLIQTLPTFWAERILILIFFFFCIFLDPKLLAWAHLGPAWAHPLGPHVGPRDDTKGMCDQGMCHAAATATECVC